MLGLRGRVEVDGQAVGPPHVGVGDHRVGVGHAFGEGVADRDVSRPDPTVGGMRGHGSLQSTGLAPWAASRSLARLNGREPKKPPWAESGLGWADSMNGMPCG